MTEKKLDGTNTDGGKLYIDNVFVYSSWNNRVLANETFEDGENNFFNKTSSDVQVVSSVPLFSNDLAVAVLTVIVVFGAAWFFRRH